MDNAGAGFGGACRGSIRQRGISAIMHQPCEDEETYFQVIQSEHPTNMDILELTEIQDIIRSMIDSRQIGLFEERQTIH